MQGNLWSYFSHLSLLQSIQNAAAKVIFPSYCLPPPTISGFPSFFVKVKFLIQKYLVTSILIYVCCSLFLWPFQLPRFTSYPSLDHSSVPCVGKGRLWKYAAAYPNMLCCPLIVPCLLIVQSVTFPVMPRSHTITLVGSQWGSLLPHHCTAGSVVAALLC